MADEPELNTSTHSRPVSDPSRSYMISEMTTCAVVMPGTKKKAKKNIRTNLLMRLVPTEHFLQYFRRDFTFSSAARIIIALLFGGRHRGHRAALRRLRCPRCGLLRKALAHDVCRRASRRSAGDRMRSRNGRAQRVALPRALGRRLSRRRRWRCTFGKLLNMLPRTNVCLGSRGARSPPSIPHVRGAASPRPLAVARSSLVDFRLKRKVFLSFHHLRFHFRTRP